MIQAVIILVIICLMFLFGVFISFLLCKLIFGSMPNMATLSGNVTPENVGQMRMVQAVSTIFMFIGSAIITSNLYGERFKDYYHLVKIRPSFLILIAVTMFVMSGPMLSWLVDISEKIGIKGTSNNNALMEELIYSKNFGMLLVNIFVIGLLPAVGEELLFRGLLQKSLMNWTKIPWLSIVLSALIFSLFHLELDYFIARWVMGGLLGLMFYTSRSIWLPILAHFINNTVAVVSYYLYTSNPKSFPENPITNQPSYDWIELSLSIFVITLMAIMLYRYRRIAANTLSKLAFSV